MFYVDQLGGAWKLRDVSKRLEVELEAFEAGLHVRCRCIVGRSRFSQAVFVGFRWFSRFSRVFFVFLVHPFITLFTLHCCSTGGENYVGRCSPEASSPLQGPWYLVELKDLDEDTRVELE